jgi:hypothetical protein
MGRLLAGGLVAAAIAIVVILAVGGGGPAGVSGAELAHAADATIRAGGARIDSQVQLTVPGSAQQLRFEMKGVTDLSGRHVDLSADMWPAAQQLPASKRGTRADWQMRLISDWPVMYIRFSPFAKETGGKPWIKMDLRKALGAAGIDQSLSSPGSSDPSQGLQFLRASGATVQKLGTERVRGADTTHYRAVIDLRDYPKRVPASERARARQSVERIIKLTGSSTTPVEAWVDRKGLVRRVDMTINEKINGRQITAKDSTYYSAFGTRIRIVKPPADQVEDVTNLAAQGVKQSTGG